MKEKLIELMFVGQVLADAECDKQAECSKCPYNAPNACRWGFIADHLIASGVTVTDNNVGGKWISVKKRKPKVGEFVLFQYAKNNHNPTLHAKNTMAVGRYEQKMFLVEGCSVNVTHWMPLPSTEGLE